MTSQPFRSGVFIIGLMLAAGACQRESADEHSPGVRPGTADQQAAAPIRDVNSLVAATDRTQLVNRQTELTSVIVQSVSTDRVFWVGTAADRTIPVFLDDQARSALLTAQQRLTQGDHVTLVGEVRKSPGVDDLQKEWNLSAQDAEQLSRAQVYIHAKRILLGQQPQPGMQPGQPGQPQPLPAQPGQTPQPG